MLQALLHGKLASSTVDDGDAGDDPTVELAGREDPLTATVFERLSYLPFSMTWSLLEGAVLSRSGHGWPSTAPAQEPSWSFWPSLRPGTEGHNKARVEPDVVLSFGDDRVLFESKHRGTQSAWQWREQVLSARRRWPDARVTIVATGGWSPATDHDRVEQLQGILPGPLAPVFRLTWESLRAAVGELLRSGPEAHHRAVLLDIQRALVFWGYRPHQTLASLVDYCQKTRNDGVLRPDALQAWSLRGPAHASPRATGFGSLATTARLWALDDATDLSPWSVR